jgi:hypothetical protein
MKSVFAVPVILIILFFSNSLLAQRGFQSPKYDLKTVEVLKGEILKIDSVNEGQRSLGIHLLLKTEKESIDVHVGPVWYLSNQALQLKVNERVEIKGSRITYNNAPAIIAAEIKNKDQILKLRNANGFPLWSQRRM